MSIEHIEWPHTIPETEASWNDPECPCCGFHTAAASEGSDPCQAYPLGPYECGCDQCIGGYCMCTADQILTFLKSGLHPWDQ